MATVLVIDDSRFHRNMVAGVLQRAGYDVIEAGDGKQGLAAVEANRIDCILVDLLMPVMSGLEFLERLREDTRAIPVLVLTADIQDATRSLCEKFGISGFLNKPLKPKELLSRVEQAVSRASGAMR